MLAVTRGESLCRMWLRQPSAEACAVCDDRRPRPRPSASITTTTSRTTSYNPTKSNQIKSNQIYLQEHRNNAACSIQRRINYMRCTNAQNNNTISTILVVSKQVSKYKTYIAPKLLLRESKKGKTVSTKHYTACVVDMSRLINCVISIFIMLNWQRMAVRQIKLDWSKQQN